VQRCLQEEAHASVSDRAAQQLLSGQLTGHMPSTCSSCGTTAMQPSRLLACARQTGSHQTQEDEP
jgi:hypothetical protein